MTFDQFYSGYQCVSFGYLWLNVPGKPRMMRQKVRKAEMTYWAFNKNRARTYKCVFFSHRSLLKQKSEERSTSTTTHRRTAFQYFLSNPVINCELKNKAKVLWRTKVSPCADFTTKGGGGRMLLCSDLSLDQRLI